MECWKVEVRYYSLNPKWFFLKRDGRRIYFPVRSIGTIKEDSFLVISLGLKKFYLNLLPVDVVPSDFVALTESDYFHVRINPPLTRNFCFASVEDLIIYLVAYGYLNKWCKKTVEESHK